MSQKHRRHQSAAPLLPPADPPPSRPDPWRAFADEKPTEDGRVWLVHAGETYLGTWDTAQQGFYFMRGQQSFFTQTLVTHWQPAVVPAPPKET